MAPPTRQVLIYGPPAAGKLSVARALAARYSLGLLDNHLTTDVALRLFPFGTEEFGSLVNELRDVLFRAAASASTSTVATFVYAPEVDGPYVERLRHLSDHHSVELDFVQLRPPPVVLEARVVAQSREGTGKIRDLTVLRSLLQRWDLYAPINVDDLSIDNSTLTPDEVAEVIGSHLGL